MLLNLQKKGEKTSSQECNNNMAIQSSNLDDSLLETEEDKVFVGSVSQMSYEERRSFLKHLVYSTERPSG